ncbi:Hint domain-containing protein [Ruegeria marina]|uniref:Hint domain-containing protein n=1 Tax=Ruegeria marina TaxID=639004 RepID=A0A1G7C0Y5_9RHOB|nr:Hint domain-containing protein [Ruegeria marina]SDE32939.1 Hint domain-containing protein [Ruegeria marina]
MANITLTAQNVNGDPFVNGGTINIVNNSTSVLTFVDVDTQLNDPLSGEYVSFDGGLTLLSYQYLGVGDVRGDPGQCASFIRIDLGDGNFMTVALDMNADFDDLPDLQNGNTQLTIGTLDTTSTNWFPGFACFAAGTFIEVEGGPVPVETLRPGDMVRTLDNGFQPLAHLAHTTVRGEGALAPVVFKAGALGNFRDLVVSQQHRMLLSGWQTELVCGVQEVFAPAQMLVNDTTIRIVPRHKVSYYHLLFAQHEIVFSEGIPTESYFPGAFQCNDATSGDAETGLFPHLANLNRQGWQTARRVAKTSEVRLLTAA